MPHLTFPRLALSALSLSAILNAAPLTVPLSTFTPAVLADLPASERATARLELILLPSLTTSLTAVTGPATNGDAQSRILPPETWVPGAPFTFEVANSAAGRVHVGYRALSADGSQALTPYRILQASGEPTALFYGDANAEPIHMGLMRLPDGGGLGLLTLGAPAGREIQVSVRVPGAIFPLVNLNLNAPPATCATGSTLTALMAAWTTGHTQGLLRQADGLGGTRYTLVYALSAADLATATSLEFTVAEKATGKLLADGFMGTLTLPSVRQWIAQYDARLSSGAPSAPAATRLGLFCIALRGLAHADAKRPGFDFLQPDVHFADYAQMSAAFNAALKVPAPSPLGRLAQIYAAVRALNQSPLQDPVRLSLKTPKDNVVFSEGYTRMEFDTLFAPASISTWPEASDTRDLRLLLVHSKNIALYRRDRTKGPYAFAPLLPVAHDVLPPLAGADPNAAPNADALTLPVTGPSLRALLRDGLYVRGNPGDTALPEEPFVLNIRVIRDTTLAAVPRAQLQAVAADLLPSAGSVISGPENSAFQIWPVVHENGTSKYIKDARFGHYMNRGQTRSLAYAYEYKLGAAVLFRVDGPDSAKVTATTPPTMLGAGKALRFAQNYASGGTVGAGMNGLLFRAVDYRVDEGDTTVLRVFERQGSLFGLGLVAPDAGGSPDAWPVRLNRDAVAPVRLGYESAYGLPDSLSHKGEFEVWMDADMRLYTDSLHQREDTRLTEPVWSIQMQRAKNNSQYYSFKLYEEIERSRVYSAETGIQNLQALVGGGQSEKTVRLVYRPQGEAGRYLEEAVTTAFMPVNCRARIAGDFVNIVDEKQIDSLDFKYLGPHEIVHWETDYSVETNKAGSNVAGANNYKITMDMVPFRVVLPSSPSRYSGSLQNETSAILSFQQTSRDYIKDNSWMESQILAPLFLKALKPNRIPRHGWISLGQATDTLNYLIAGKGPGSGLLYSQVGNDGLQANTDSVRLRFYDISEEMAVYSARYVNKEGDADRLAEEEGVGSYTWEQGVKLNEALYGQNQFKIFPLKRVKQFAGHRFADIESFQSKDSLFVFIHGFNSKEKMDETYTTGKTMFKKLKIQGYPGHFLSFHWYGDFNPDGKNGGMGILADILLFPVDQLNAFKSSSSLLTLLADTLAQFPSKRLLVHSLGNQVVLDMLRQASFTSNPTKVGVSHYNILEAAVAQSVFDFPAVSPSEQIRLHNWQGLFNHVSGDHPAVHLNNFKRKDDNVVGIIFKTNELAKTVPFLWTSIWNATMVLGNPSDALKSERLVACPLPTDFSQPRKPKDLAVCFTAGRKTLPGDGIPDAAWLNKNEFDVDDIYNTRAPKWKTQNAHSYFNTDEVYKTKFITQELLK